MPEPFDKTYWEERYRSHSGHRGEPNGQLVTEAADLPPGRALDAGCGEGADAVWLALRGWHVTAVDISATALGHGRQHAMTLGTDIADRIDWVEGDLTTWKPEPEHYDLVTSQYVHPTGPFDALVASLAAAVAPGGTLLIVGHHPADDEHGHGHGADEPHGPAPGSLVSVEEVTAALDPERWEVLVAETRSRPATAAHGEPVMLHDSVVKARRVSG